MRAVAADGAEYLTMGLAPLASPVWDPTHVNPLWLRLLLAWIRAHGQRFYNFSGLETFKGKFGPREWEPIYAISQESHFSPWTLYAVADAFADGTLPATLLVGAAKAIREEWRRLTISARRAPGPSSGGSGSAR